MKIIVRAPNWIGDAVMSLPAISCLHQNYPSAEIWVAAKGWVKDLYLGYDFINHIFCIPDKPKISSLKQAAEKIKKQNFDIGLLLTNSFVSAMLFYMARIPERWGYNRDGRFFLLTSKIRVPKFEEKRHHVQYYLHLISGLGLAVYKPKLSLPLMEDEIREADDRLRSSEIGFDNPIVMLNPGAFFGTAKQWPTSRFITLAQMLQEQSNADIVIVGSPEERVLADTIASRLTRSPLVLTGETSLRQLASLIHHASLFVSNDSGPMHIANAVKTPVIAIFGPTDHRVTGPFQPPSLIIRKEAPCWPCLYRKCPFDHRCMLSIQPKEVFQACQRFLS